MPPPSNSTALHLIVLPEPFFVVKLKPGQEIAPCLIKDLTSGKGSFFSVTRTSEEVSVVGESYKWMPSSYKEQSTWMAIKIQGPMEHSLTGIMASLTAPLKLAKVPVFALSTWNTDYVLVPTEMLAEAIRSLERDGWLFVQGVKSGLARL
ncbi:hypothetical protein HYPSUDRAFT_129304 [Hypholoma sublateritium FD-334 SS-4]|uniref:CASTOR ACT domain-containing protein n=1 Tax=Hypholoma sublateritium (strain FD-334 SS-4) TaxID=945553 RepID=A0A0D2MWW2_HYPSF|nr:hypothetical protein HYPSUDRAFT_129304 [Hypholoma sublateritium FD-334 SS-4]